MDNLPLYRYNFVPAPPLQTVRSGDTLRVTVPDADGLGPMLEPLPDAQFEGGRSNLGNPLYGPIAVEGAQPGDTLEVELLETAPNRRIARTLLAPGHGFLPDELLRRPRHLHLWEMSDDGHSAHLLNPLGEHAPRIPLQPFPGALGTATTAAPSTRLAGPYGGNLDHPDLRPGTRLWLPVEQPGGLLYLGDLHAAQGAGETIGGGLEISGTLTIRVHLHQQDPLPTPRYETVQGIAALGIGPDLPSATQTALAHLVQWISREQAWHPGDAWQFVSQTCEFRLGGIASGYAVVSCYVARSRFI